MPSSKVFPIGLAERIRCRREGACDRGVARFPAQVAFDLVTSEGFEGDRGRRDRRRAEVALDDASLAQVHGAAGLSGKLKVSPVSWLKTSVKVP